MRYAYPARLRRDETGRVVVSFPDVPEALTDGADEREALREAADALAAALGGYVAEGRPIPPPGWSGQGPWVPVPALVAAKLALYEAMREQGISKSELARRLVVSETVVRRLVDPDHASRIEKLQEALAVLGRQLVVGVEDAA